jgi:hypothetical protein
MSDDNRSRRSRNSRRDARKSSSSSLSGRISDTIRRMPATPIHRVGPQSCGGIDEMLLSDDLLLLLLLLLLNTIRKVGRPGCEVRLAAERQRGRPVRGTSGAVLALADLHVDTACGEKEGDGGADGDACDDGR